MRDEYDIFMGKYEEDHQCCPQCGSDGNEVDLVNEAVEAAIRISAHVEFTDNEYLKEIGGVAALLRW